jgi:hypothetical protein
MDNQMQEFENILRTKLESKIFEIPKENLANLHEVFKKMMDVCSLEKLQCDNDVYGSILNQLVKDEAPSFTLYNISFLLNALTRLSPKDLEISAFEYNKALFYSTDLAKQWNTIVAPIQKKLQVDFKNRLVVEAKKNGTKPNLIIK